MIRSKKLIKIKDLKHCFFNSIGGQSKNIYKSLNCGLGSLDNKKNIKKNLQLVRKKISKKAKNIFLLNQIHSNKFIFIGKKYNNNNKPKADAIITDQRNIPIAVLTADCAPILIYDDKIKMIAAIHAGWKGAFKGIVSKVIKFMIKKGCKLENITAAIGPSISQKNFPIAVLTADCAPILIYEDKMKMIAAIHAGWKGAFKGIITKVIKFMIKKGCKLENITAVVGPSISQKNYEVKDDFKKKFIQKDKKNYLFFKNKKNRLYFDLTNYIYASLKTIKVKNIDILKIDTFDIKNKFFSARRALKLKHNDYGRNISIIMLN